MAKIEASVASPAAADRQAGVPVDDLLEMMRAAAARTEQALAAPTLPDAGVYESMPIAVHPGRLGENPTDVIERYLIGQGYPPDQARALAYGPEAAGGGLESLDVNEGFAEPLPGLERIIGKDMLMQVDYLEAGVVSAKAIGRVQIRNGNGGYGTGFLISPRLLLTNNHVLPTAVMAAESRVEFNYQRNLDGGLGPSAVYDLDPDLFFVTSSVKELDFTIVAVQEKPLPAPPLASYGHHPLTAVKDEILAGACVTIIQHPKGDPKQIALRENEVLKLPDSGQKFLHYKTGTHPGSSGSPVFNDAWNVVALHHAGKPETDANHVPILIDGTPWKPGVSVDTIKWVANEGIRVAAIVDCVAAQALDPARKALFAEALQPRKLFQPRREFRETSPAPGPGTESAAAAPIAAISSPPVTRDGADGAGPATVIPTSTTVLSSAASPVSPPQAPAAALVSGGGILTIPLVVSIQLGTATATVAAQAAAAPDGLAPLEKIEIDQDYRNREGYAPDFLGTGVRKVPLPRPSAAVEAEAAVSKSPPRGGPKYELTYHHFSVVLNRTRKLAVFTAVNIDGTQPRAAARETDRWIFDPRVDSSLQVGNEFYRRPFDRGHLVRRLDPAWGRSERVAKSANDDTFHFTNCCPQHARFNQGKALWAGLEDYLLGKAAADVKRLIVFTGPVFRDDDPEFDGVKIPLEYWKVAATLNPAGKLVAAGFLVSQKELVAPATLEVSAEQVARTFQVPVREIERKAGLNFGRLADIDATAAQGFYEIAEPAPRELESLDQIVLD
jgi:endonuclease G